MYLTRAKINEDGYDLVLALSAAEQAANLGASSALDEARFNRALALEQIGLVTSAQLAWEAYLAKDMQSQWAQEALTHLSSLRRVADPLFWRKQEDLLDTAALKFDHRSVMLVVKDFPQEARLYAESVLMGGWARATAEGQVEKAHRDLTIAVEIGEALRLTSGDRMLSDSLAKIREGASDDLVQGHIMYARAVDLVDAGRYKDAIAPLTKARDSLVRGGSPFSGWAVFQLALCHYQGSSYNTAMTALTRILNKQDNKTYNALQGRASWLLGRPFIRFA